MQLTKHLVLFRYILKQFGYDDFETLREEFNNIQTGYDSAGRSSFAGVLGWKPIRIPQETLFRYDESIRTYEERLKTNRAEPKLTFKYFQWFALLFTEYYFDRLTTDTNQLITDLNNFKNTYDDYSAIENYNENDLKKLAFWMATGSGKTLIMHCNYWQIRKYFKDWENIILITPNEGMSQQHYESFTASGIDSKIYSGSEESLKTKEGEILIIEITKLVKEKEGEGVSVDVDYFAETKNLVFIDEGHKGQRSEEKKWKSLREHITRSNDSYTFEYSATFGQIITSRTNELLQEYGRSIIFDYSYRHFYADGYGKDFAVFNIEAEEEYNDEQIDLLLTAGLLTYYEQVILFEKFESEIRQYEIEKPLWIFVGSKVIGNGSSTLTQTDKKNISDVTRVIKFLQNILSSPKLLQQNVDKILSGSSGLMNSDGVDIFEDRLRYLKENRPSIDDVLSKLFNGSGQIEAYQIKNAEGEIGLKTKTSDKYFAVINIGDVAKYSKKLEEDTDGKLVIQEDNFTSSLFYNLSETDSTVNLLIGSKKFIEGWNSWRVSCMGLLNMGKGEGAQIIQLFGRGVRLKGKELSLKRENELSGYPVRALQTISIFGLNASYMNNFLTNIEKETPEYKEYPVEIRFNYEGKWANKIVTFKKDDNHNFKEYLVVLDYNEEIAKRVTIDLRNRVMAAVSGFNNQIAENIEEYSGSLLKEFYDFIDLENLLTEIKNYTLIRGYTNLVITKEAVVEILLKLRPESILCGKDQFTIKDAIEGKIQRVAEAALKDYVQKFYSDKEKDSLTRNLSIDLINYDSYRDIFPTDKRMIIKAPKEHRRIVDQLIKDMNQFYENDLNEIPTIHFDKHLYSPIATFRKGEIYQQIKTIPVKLNAGETKFVKQIRDFIRDNSKKLTGIEIFLLRNLSQRGVGFFLESSSFFPDFILWVVKDKKQYIYFLDPKGIRMMTNFNHPKVLFCTKQVKEINESLKEKIAKEKKGLEIELSAFILSVTKYNDIKENWGSERTSKEDFTRNNILFVDDNKAYLQQLFDEFVEN
ncbi:MAG: DEAD/DEAH box helicase family protein [Melioribacteraceae bacterium]|nr:MAG: DEAD/DEAH box helicase family protein [Melioribacteraceae bacterium]